MSIGKRIEQIRLDNGLSQKEFSERIFKDKSSISKLESDKIELSPSMLRAICRTFNIREEWLKTGKGEKFPDKKEYPDANGLSDEFIFIRQIRL